MYNNFILPYHKKKINASPTIFKIFSEILFRKKSLDSIIFLNFLILRIRDYLIDLDCINNFDYINLLNIYKTCTSNRTIIQSETRNS